MIKDYFYPLSRIMEYKNRFSVRLLCCACCAFSGYGLACFALWWPVERLAIYYTVSALCLICLNFRLGVLIGESENPPMS